jgi:aconitase B
VKNFAGLWMVVSNDAANGVVALGAKGGVIPFDINRSIIIKYD